MATHPALFHPLQHGRRPVPSGSRGAFSLVELLVVVAILAILASLLLPSLTAAKSKAWSARCKSNLRQVSVALRLYVDDAGAFPMIWVGSKDARSVDHTRWRMDLLPHLSASLRDRKLFECPAPKESRQRFFAQQLEAGDRSFGYNVYGYQNGGGTFADLFNGLGGIASDPLQPGRATRESEVTSPAEMIAIGDNFTSGPEGTVMAGGPLLLRAAKVFGSLDSVTRGWVRMAGRHESRANIQFADGHVASLLNRQLFLDPSDAALSRWNKDHQPHR